MIVIYDKNDLAIGSKNKSLEEIDIYDIKHNIDNDKTNISMLSIILIEDKFKILKSRIYHKHQDFFIKDKSELNDVITEHLNSLNIIRHTTIYDIDLNAFTKQCDNVFNIENDKQNE